MIGIHIVDTKTGERVTVEPVPVRTLENPGGETVDKVKSILSERGDSESPSE